MTSIKRLGMDLRTEYDRLNLRTRCEESLKKENESFAKIEASMKEVPGKFGNCYRVNGSEMGYYHEIKSLQRELKSHTDKLNQLIADDYSIFENDEVNAVLKNIERCKNALVYIRHLRIQTHNY